MSGVITAGAHPKALWPGVDKWWGMKYDEHEQEFIHIFTVESSDKSREELVETTGFGLIPEKSEGGPVSYGSHSQQTVNTAQHNTYGLGWIVTAEEIEDNLYKERAFKRTEAMAFSANQTIETLGANVLNRAFSGSFTFGDGVSLINTAHPTVAGNQSNRLAVAADLSEASLEDQLIQIMKALNSRGHKIPLKGKCLIVPPALSFEAVRILKSTLQNDTANNAINAIKATGCLPDGVKVNHYLSDADAWFIKTGIPAGLTWYWRRKPTFTKDNDFDTDNAKAKVTFRSSTTVGDWRDIWGSPGA